MKLSREFKEFNKSNVNDSLIIRYMREQLDLIKNINDCINETKDLNPIFYLLFNYKSLKIYIGLLSDYTKNPIMLKKDKLFEEEYRLDIKKIFKKIKIRMGIQIPILTLLFTIVAFYLLLRKY